MEQQPFFAIFADLIQTPGVVVPILIAFAALGVVFTLWRYRLDDNDYLLAEEEERRSREQEAKLTYLAEHGDLPPAKERADDPNRGADRPKTIETGSNLTLPVGLLSFASDYGFEAFAHQAKNQVILFDLELVGFDPDRRVYTLDMDQVQEASQNELKHLVAKARTTINKRGKRAGVTPTRRKAGRPVKEVIR